MSFNRFKTGDKVVVKSCNTKGTVAGVYDTGQGRKYDVEISDSARGLFYEPELMLDEVSHNGTETTLILPAGVDWKPEEKKKQCTCGISAIGGGLHSDWCDLGKQ